VRRDEGLDLGVDPTGTRRRPVTSDDPPTDILDRDRVENAAVNRGATAIVAQYPHGSCRNTVVGFGAHRAISPWIGEHTIVDADLSVLGRDPFAGEPDDPLEEESVGVRRVVEDHDVTTSRHATPMLGDHPVIRFERRSHRIIDDRETSRYSTDRRRSDRDCSDDRGGYPSRANAPSFGRRECTEQNPRDVLTRCGRVANNPTQWRESMKIVERILAPRHEAHAHCDLFCGTYDPAQAMIEAVSCLKIAEKYQASNDDVFRSRAISIKEQSAELVKHHLWVLWTDFFEPKHVEEFPGLHDLFWRATKAAGEAKKTMDPAASQRMIDLIAEVSDVFWATEKAQAAGVYPPR